MGGRISRVLRLVLNPWPPVCASEESLHPDDSRMSEVRDLEDVPKWFRGRDDSFLPIEESSSNPKGEGVCCLDCCLYGPGMYSSPWLSGGGGRGHLLPGCMARVCIRWRSRSGRGAPSIFRILLTVFWRMGQPGALGGAGGPSAGWCVAREGTSPSARRP